MSAAQHTPRSVVEMCILPVPQLSGGPIPKESPMGTYVTTPASVQTDESGSYVSASRSHRGRSTGYVSGTETRVKAGAYICSNLK